MYLDLVELGHLHPDMQILSGLPAGFLLRLQLPEPERVSSFRWPGRWPLLFILKYHLPRHVHLRTSLRLL